MGKKERELCCEHLNVICLDRQVRERLVAVATMSEWMALTGDGRKARWRERERETDKRDLTELDNRIPNNVSN